MDMPIRVMSYDAAMYRTQLDDKERKNRYPVITLVLYFGTERKWESNRSLLERLEVSEELKPFVSDYKINVINLAWLEEERIELFKSDFRFVAEYLRAARLKRVYEGSLQTIKHIECILDVFKALSGNNEFKNIENEILELSKRERRGVKMFDVFQAAMDKGFALGRNEGISLGRSEGILQGRSEGILQGRSEGILQGRNEGQNSIIELFSKLYSLGRASDVEKATKDKAYLKQLLEEYQK